MSEPRVLILTGLGLNCEAETEAAFTMAGARPETVHLLDLLDGSAARVQLRHVVAESVRHPDAGSVKTNGDGR